MTAGLRFRSFKELVRVAEKSYPKEIPQDHGHGPQKPPWWELNMTRFTFGSSIVGGLGGFFLGSRFIDGGAVLFPTMLLTLVGALTGEFLSSQKLAPSPPQPDLVEQANRRAKAVQWYLADYLERERQRHIGPESDVQKAQNRLQTHLDEMVRTKGELEKQAKVDRALKETLLRGAQAAEQTIERLKTSLEEVQLFKTRVESYLAACEQTLLGINTHFGSMQLLNRLELRQAAAENAITEAEVTIAQKVFELQTGVVETEALTHSVYWGTVIEVENHDAPLPMLSDLHREIERSLQTFPVPPTLESLKE